MQSKLSYLEHFWNQHSSVKVVPHGATNSVLNFGLENGRELQKSCFQPSPLKVNSNHPVKEQCSPKLLLSARKDKFFKSKLI